MQKGYTSGDTIAAQATAPGSGAIGIVRLSGPQSFSIVQSLLAKPLPIIRQQRVYVRELLIPVDTAQPAEDDAVLHERAVISFSRAPNSYSGEDMAEISVHGNPLLLRLLLSACISAGARLAEAGEFTYRAYLNGRLDLAQAEAVHELISAGSRRGLALAGSALAGKQSQRAREWAEALTAQIAAIEVIHDYASDDLDASVDPALLPDHARLARQLSTLSAEMQQALFEAERSAPMRSGITIAICGPPNVGKSTLFNALLGHERSITAPEPGTTRDYIRETMEASGILLTLVDTAGYRDSADAVEAAGVRRSGDWSRAADRVLWVSAADQEPAEPPQEFAALEPIYVRTRCDLLVAWPQDSRGVHHVSGLSGRGIAELAEALAAGASELGEPALDSFSQRQAQCVARSQDYLQRALAACADKEPFDIVAAELYSALAALRSVYEEPQHSAVVNAIFSGFCVGK